MTSNSIIVLGTGCTGLHVSTWLGSSTKEQLIKTRESEKLDEKAENAKQVPVFSTMTCFTCSHYENTPMQYTENVLVVKMKVFTGQKFDIFLIFAQNIDCGGYTLEPPYEYPQSMFWGKNKKNRYTPAYPNFAI